MLTNLIGNAMKFTPERGSVDVKAVPEEGCVRVSVRDTGRGIRPEDLPHVFEKFRQFSRVEGPGEKGAGLGLAIAKDIVELHGGTMQVDSVLNMWSEFSFTVPRFDSWLDQGGGV